MVSLVAPRRLALLCALCVAVPVWGDDNRSNGELLRGGGVVEEIIDVAPGEQVVPAAMSAVASSEGDAAADENTSPLAARAAQPPAALPRSTSDHKPLALARRGEKRDQAPDRSASPAHSLITVGGSLCIVLFLFCSLALLTRRSMPRSAGKLPGEVIEVLGKAPLVKGQDLQLLRVGSKLVLICVTPHGCETLTEITDPLEVDRLSVICRRNGPASVSTAFNQVLAGLGREPASGFTDDVRTASSRRGGR